MKGRKIIAGLRNTRMSYIPLKKSGSGPGVSLMINGSHPFRTDMGIKLGRAQVLVSEQFLNTAEICSGIQQMSCKRVTELMRGHFRRETCCDQVIFKIPLERPGGKSCGVLIQKER